MMKYVKHNRVRVKQDKREESTRSILEFFKEIQGKASGMKGFVVMDSLDDPSESIVLTFWETRKDMDSFYQTDNINLSWLVEKLKPVLEELPERKDYQVSGLGF
ncbi:MAG: antibiotic biosynthesis monooxygenase [Thermoproteota archaeon]|nr:antibiotic biosynthesis monooxygenase [Thermoproteota archaeon]